MWHQNPNPNPDPKLIGVIIHLYHGSEHLTFVDEISQKKIIPYLV